MGMLGMSIDEIMMGKQGYVKLPLGVRDSTKWGGRKWVRVKVTAMEDVRANRDIIVGNEQGDVKEHTPVELSYEKSEGGYQRAGEDHPLPVTAGTKPIPYARITATAIGNTVIATPSIGKKIKVHYYMISNAHAANADVGMRFGTDGDIKHNCLLAASGGNINANLIDSSWAGAVDEPLYAYLVAAYAGGVYFTVGYTEE